MIITICNQKGGVAKTTTCLNLAASLTVFKKKVLLVDFDIQANLTLSLGYHNVPSFYDVLKSKQLVISHILIKTKYPNLWLIPSNSSMALLDREYFKKQGYEFILKENLELIEENFDFIIIDTPPSISFYTINALTAAHLVIIPTQCEYLSIVGVKQITKVIKMVKFKTNPRIDFKLLIIQYDMRLNISRYIYNKLNEIYKKKLFDTIISVDTKLKESQVMGRPVIYYSRQSRAGLQYLNLAKEILDGGVTNG